MAISVHTSTHLVPPMPISPITYLLATPAQIETARQTEAMTPSHVICVLMPAG